MTLSLPLWIPAFAGMAGERTEARQKAGGVRAGEAVSLVNSRRARGTAWRASPWASQSQELESSYRARALQ